MVDAGAPADDDDRAGAADDDGAARDANAAGPRVDDFRDLYFHVRGAREKGGPPPASIAAGADFGRLQPLRPFDLDDVSHLERLVLARARAHMITFKVVAYGSETERRRLGGHVVVCPHEATSDPEVVPQDFGHAAIKAALGELRILFVGPKNQRTKLEQAALKIRDLRLRPHVLYNALYLRHMLHGDTPPPPRDEVVALVAEHGDVRAHIAAHARHSEEEGVERAAAGSDHNQVRTSAQSKGLAAAEADDNEAADAPVDEGLEPQLEASGLFEYSHQDVSAVIAGIDRCCTGEADAAAANGEADAAAANGDDDDADVDDDDADDGTSHFPDTYHTLTSLLPPARSHVSPCTCPCA